MSFGTIGKIFAGTLGAKFLAQTLIKFGGASTGFALGIMLFDALFPERPNSESSKLSDLHYMGSSYGTSWAKVWGDARIGGQVSYLHKDSLGNHFKEASSGGSKKSPSSPTYTFTGFVGFCQAALFFPDNTSASGGTTSHRNHRIVQIWANQSELIYEEIVAGVITTNPYNIVVVQGTEVQAADSDIVTLEGLSINTPAMVSICGCYLKSFPTKKFGDTIPQLSARVKTDTVSTGDIISDILQLHGAKPAQFDVSLCTDPVTGMVWNNREQGRNALEQILVAYDIDEVEVDGKLKFIPRTAAATYDIDEKLLGATTGGSTFKSSRKHPSADDRPSRVSVFFMDPNSSFNQNTAEASRQTVYDGSDYNLSTTLVLTATQAEFIAMRTLDRFWAELDEVTISLPTHGMIYAPGDNLRITVDGVQTKFRITKMIMAPLGEVKITGTVVDDDTLTQAVTGSNGNSNPTPTEIVPSTFMPFSSKEMLDDHQTSAGFYVAASGDVGWMAGQVYYLPPGATEYIAGPIINHRCTFGVTTSALGSAGAIGETWDHSNTVGVNVAASFAALTDVEESSVEQGNNWAWIGDEIMGFSTAGLTGSYLYTLSDLLRGLRSSSMTDHLTGERFVLSSSSMVHIAVPDSHVGLTYQVKVLSGGQLITDVTAQPVVIKARTLTDTEQQMAAIQAQVNGLAAAINVNEFGGSLQFDMKECQTVLSIEDVRIEEGTCPRLTIIQNSRQTEDSYVVNVLNIENGIMRVVVTGSKADGKPIRKSRSPLTLAYMVS